MGFFLCKPQKPLRKTEVFLWIIPCIVWPGSAEARRAQGRPLSIGIWSLHCSAKTGVFWPLGHIINLCYSFRLLLWSIHCGKSSGLCVVPMKLFTPFNISYMCRKHITWKHLYPGNTIQINAEEVKVENGFDFTPICTIQCSTAGYTILKHLISIEGVIVSFYCKGCFPSSLSVLRGSLWLYGSLGKYSTTGNVLKSCLKVLCSFCLLYLRKNGYSCSCSHLNSKSRGNLQLLIQRGQISAHGRWSCQGSTAVNTASCFMALGTGWEWILWCSGGPTVRSEAVSECPPNITIGC